MVFRGNFAQKRVFVQFLGEFFSFFLCYSKISSYFCSKQIFNLQKNTTMSEIDSRVKAIIVEKFGVSESEVTPEANFTNDLSADSLDRVELIMEIEDEFGISIPEDAAEKIATVGDAVKFVEEMVANK